MTITRRLLIPTIAFFALILVALVLINTFSINQVYQDREEAILKNLYQALQSQLNAQQDFALALATEVAYNPEVQAAFAARDRDRLTELTLPAYQLLNQQFDVPQHQFHIPPATSYLRLHALNQYGDDLSSFRFTVLAANAQKQPVSGLEIGRGGLGVRGVVPVSYQGQHIGSAEFGLNVDLTLIQALKEQFGADWQILLSRGPAQVATFEGATGEAAGPIPDLLLQASTLETPLFGSDDSYRRALGGNISISRTGSRQHNYAILSAPLLDYSDNVIGVVDIISERTDVLTAQSSRFIQSMGIVLLTLLTGGIGVAVYITRTLRPISALTAAATDIAAGDLQRAAEVESQDEIGMLARAFNSMTAQLRELINSLEQRVTERTRDLEESHHRIQRRAAQLEASARVAHAAASVLDPDELLRQIVHLISDSFGHYHTGIFTLDETGRWAVLRAANSAGGQRMLARGHRLEVGVTGIVGNVAHTGHPRIALDVGADAIYFDNPDLPETRSEMALPLKARGQTIGVLDVQSTHPDAFDQEDIAVLSTLADQVAVALDNARLYQASQNALTQVQAIQSQYAQQAWHTYADQLKPQLYEFRLKRPDAGVSDDSPIVTLDADSPTQDDQATMSVPLHVHGQVIGALGLQDAPGRTWTDDEIALVETIADQISQAMEAARLFEETQRRAQREQLLTAITDKIRSAHDMDGVLRIAVQEMRRALGVSHAAIRLGTETHLQRTSKTPGPTSAVPKNGDASEPASAKPELDAGDGRDD